MKVDDHGVEGFVRKWLQDGPIGITELRVRGEHLKISASRLDRTLQRLGAARAWGTTDTGRRFRIVSPPTDQPSPTPRPDEDIVPIQRATECGRCGGALPKGRLAQVRGRQTLTDIVTWYEHPSCPPPPLEWTEVPYRNELDDRWLSVAFFAIAGIVLILMILEPG